MHIKNCKLDIILSSVLFFSFVNFSSQAVFASELQGIDIIRYELNAISDKNSKEYVKTKLKLEEYIAENKIDYSNEFRLNDARRLIKEQKYAAAIYELKELIELNYKENICNELLGDICLKYLRDNEKALKYFEKSLELEFNNPTCAYKAARIYFSQQNNAQGLECIKAVIENTDDENILNKTILLLTNAVKAKNRLEANNVYEFLGHINLKLKMPKKAIYNYEQALKLNPEDMHLRYHLATLLQENEEYADALILYDSILKVSPNDTQIKFSKAQIFEKTNRIQEAIAEYKEILNIYPTSAQAQYALFNILRYKCNAKMILKELNVKNSNYTPQKQDYINFMHFLERMNDEEGAKIFRTKVNKITQEENTVKKEKKEVSEKNNKAEAKLLEKESLDKSIIQQKEKNNKLSQKEEIKKEPKKEIIQKQTTKEIEKHKEQSIKKQEAQKQQPVKKQELQKQQPTKKAIDTSTKQISKELEKAKLKNPQKYNEYMATIEKYQKMEPKTAEIYLAIANTYKMMNAQQNAIENIKKAIKLSPVESDLYYALGLTYLELNNTKEAKANLIKAINLNKDNAKAQNLLLFVNQKIVTKIINDSYGLFEHNKFIEALELLDNGIKEYSNNSQLYYYRALVYNAINRNAAQIIDLQKAIELDSSNYMAFYQLGLAYEKINDERSALVAYERFLSTEPDEQELIDEVQKKVISLSKKYY